MYRIIPLIFFLLLVVGCNNQDKNDSYDNELEVDAFSESDTMEYDDPLEVSEFDALIKKYEDPERVNWQNPDMVLEKMGDLTGKSVADIGVGTGYFAFRIVKNGGVVIGIDIEQRFLDYIEERKSDLPANLAGNIITRLTDPDNPNLKANEVDWVLIVNTFYILDSRITYLERIREGLKPEGKLLVVDFKIGDLPVGPNDVEKVAVDQAINELKTAGFSIVETDTESLQYQYIIVAQK